MQHHTTPHTRAHTTTHVWIPRHHRHYLHSCVLVGQIAKESAQQAVLVQMDCKGWHRTFIRDLTIREQPEQLTIAANDNHVRKELHRRHVTRKLDSSKYTIHTEFTSRSVVISRLSDAFLRQLSVHCQTGPNHNRVSTTVRRDVSAKMSRNFSSHPS